MSHPRNIGNSEMQGILYSLVLDWIHDTNRKSSKRYEGIGFEGKNIDTIRILYSIIGAGPRWETRLEYLLFKRNKKLVPRGGALSKRVHADRRMNFSQSQSPFSQSQSPPASPEPWDSFSLVDLTQQRLKTLHRQNMEKKKWTPPPPTTTTLTKKNKNKNKNKKEQFTVASLLKPKEEEKKKQFTVASPLKKSLPKAKRKLDFYARGMTGLARAGQDVLQNVATRREFFRKLLVMSVKYAQLLVKKEEAEDVYNENIETLEEWRKKEIEFFTAQTSYINLDAEDKKWVILKAEYFLNYAADKIVSLISRVAELEVVGYQPLEEKWGDILAPAREAYRKKGWGVVEGGGGEGGSTSPQLGGVDTGKREGDDADEEPLRHWGEGNWDEFLNMMDDEYHKIINLSMIKYLIDELDCYMYRADLEPLTDVYKMKKIKLRNSFFFIGFDTMRNQFKEIFTAVASDDNVVDAVDPGVRGTEEEKEAATVASDDNAGDAEVTKALQYVYQILQEKRDNIKKHKDDDMYKNEDYQKGAWAAELIFSCIFDPKHDRLWRLELIQILFEKTYVDISVLEEEEEPWVGPQVVTYGPTKRGGGTAREARARRRARRAAAATAEATKKTARAKRAAARAARAAARAAADAEAAEAAAKAQAADDAEEDDDDGPPNVEDERGRRRALYAMRRAKALKAAAAAANKEEVEVVQEERRLAEEEAKKEKKAQQLEKVVARTKASNWKLEKVVKETKAKATAETKRATAWKTKVLDIGHGVGLTTTTKSEMLKAAVKYMFNDHKSIQDVLTKFILAGKDLTYFPVRRLHTREEKSRVRRDLLELNNMNKIGIDILRSISRRAIAEKKAEKALVLAKRKFENARVDLSSFLEKTEKKMDILNLAYKEWKAREDNGENGTQVKSGEGEWGANNADVLSVLLKHAEITKIVGVNMEKIEKEIENEEKEGKMTQTSYNTYTTSYEDFLNKVKVALEKVNYEVVLGQVRGKMNLESYDDWQTAFVWGMLRAYNIIAEGTLVNNEVTFNLQLTEDGWCNRWKAEVESIQLASVDEDDVRQLISLLNVFLIIHILLRVISMKGGGAGSLIQSEWYMPEDWVKDAEVQELGGNAWILACKIINDFDTLTGNIDNMIMHGTMKILRAIKIYLEISKKSNLLPINIVMWTADNIFNTPPPQASITYKGVAKKGMYGNVDTDELYGERKGRQGTHPQNVFFRIMDWNRKASVLQFHSNAANGLEYHLSPQCDKRMLCGTGQDADAMSSCSQRQGFMGTINDKRDARGVVRIYSFTDDEGSIWELSDTITKEEEDGKQVGQLVCNYKVQVCRSPCVPPSKYTIDTTILNNENNWKKAVNVLKASKYGKTRMHKVAGSLKRILSEIKQLDNGNIPGTYTLTSKDPQPFQLSAKKVITTLYEILYIVLDIFDLKVNEFWKFYYTEPLFRTIILSIYEMYCIKKAHGDFRQILEQLIAVPEAIPHPAGHASAKGNVNFEVHNVLGDKATQIIGEINNVHSWHSYQLHNDRPAIVWATNIATGWKKQFINKYGQMAYRTSGYLLFCIPNEAQKDLDMPTRQEYRGSITGGGYPRKTRKRTKRKRKQKRITKRKRKQKKRRRKNKSHRKYKRIKRSHKKKHKRHTR